MLLSFIIRRRMRKTFKKVILFFREAKNGFLNYPGNNPRRGKVSERFTVLREHFRL